MAGRREGQSQRGAATGDRGAGGGGKVVKAVERDLGGGLVHWPPEAILEDQLDQRVAALEEELGCDVTAFVGRIVYGSDELVREALEGIESKREGLAVVLETTGGYIEVAQRMAHVLRHHYDRVAFIVPDFAMSAGTVLVMSGDAIYMDYFSVVGPIDPQVSRPGGDAIPALGYLVWYERLLERSRAGKLTPAELSFLVETFDAAELYQYEQARELSISLLVDWLVRYKLRDWKETETRRRRVTPALRRARAVAVARKLSDTDRWHSHSRGISMEVLRRDLKLRIEDFGEVERLRGRVMSYYRLLRDFMELQDHPYALHRRGAYVPIPG